MQPEQPKKLFSVGHSTRSEADFIELLQSLQIQCLVDVRRTPFSSRNPQFQQRNLRYGLAEAGIEYLWLGDSLGGQQPERVAFEDSANRAWEEPALRNYADALTTAEFAGGLAQLEEVAGVRTTAILCAERNWRQCHRKILSDVLVARDWRLVHCADVGQAEDHRLSAWARLDGDGVSYPTLL